MKTRFLNVLVLALVAPRLFAGATDTLTSITANPTYASAAFAVCVIDPATSAVLLERESTRSVLPASCLKAVTTAASMHFLGPDHRFQTDLVAQGEIVDGVLRGNLVIRGGGDPALGSDRVKSALTSPTLLRRWVDAVTSAGIHGIEGAIVGNTSFLAEESTPEEWTWSDIGNYYGAGTSGLCFVDNLYYLTFQPGTKVGAPALILRTDPPTPELEWTNLMKTGPTSSGDQGYIYGSPGTVRRTARGTIPMGPPFTIKGSLSDPARTAAVQLRQALMEAGVPVGGPAVSSCDPATSAGRVLDTLDSPPAIDIVRVLNKISFNLYAEMMLLHNGRSVGAMSRADAVAAEERWLRSLGVDLTGVYIMDGSGLSRMNAVTARALAQMMVAMRTQPHFEAWRATLPVVGVDIHLKKGKETSPLKGRVQAKTGYIERVRGLSGYLQARSGRELCFGLFANNYSGPMRDVDADYDALLQALYEEY